LLVQVGPLGSALLSVALIGPVDLGRLNLGLAAGGGVLRGLGHRRDLQIAGRGWRTERTPRNDEGDVDEEISPALVDACQSEGFVDGMSTPPGKSGFHPLVVIAQATRIDEATSATVG
jgi:hypothetical protein